MAMHEDVEVLRGLIERMEMRRRHAESEDHATQQNEPCDAARCGEALLQSAREYLAVAKTHDGTCEMPQAPSPTHRSPPLSPTGSEGSVLVGVLRRENASLIAKIRRLETDAKHRDDKSLWGEEHVVRRIKSLETQCAEALSAKTQLDAALAAKHKRVEELESTVAQLTELLAGLQDAAAQMNRVEAVHTARVEELQTVIEHMQTQLMDAQSVTAENTQLVAAYATERTRTAALQTKIEQLQSELADTQQVITENDRLKAADTAKQSRVEELEATIAQMTAQLASTENAVAEKNQLEIASAAQRTRLEELSAQVDELSGQLALAQNACDKKTRLEADHASQRARTAELQATIAAMTAAMRDVTADKDRLEVECATERDRVKELLSTVAELKSQLAARGKALFDAPADHLTRAKRSGTMETSGTDTDESDSPIRLSMLDLSFEEDCHDGREKREAKPEEPQRVSPVGGARRRSQVRRRSVTGSIAPPSQSPAPCDGSRSCTRSRCQSEDRRNQLSSSMRAERTPLARRTTLQSSPPRSAVAREPPKSISRFHTPDDHTTNAHLPIQSRPRWRL